MFQFFQSWSLAIKCPIIEKAASGLSVGTIWPAPLTCTYNKLPANLAHPCTYPCLVHITFFVCFQFLIPSQFKLFKYCKTPALFTTTSFCPLYINTFIFLNAVTTSFA